MAVTKLKASEKARVSTLAVVKTPEGATALQATLRPTGKDERRTVNVFENPDPVCVLKEAIKWREATGLGFTMQDSVITACQTDLK